MDKINFNNNSSPYINDKNLNQLQDNVETAIEDIFNRIYPIGSIYTSVNSTNPHSLFGGTWEQIKDKFLLSAGDTYNAGDEGGEATHTLTINEIPSHTHAPNDSYTDGYVIHKTNLSGGYNALIAKGTNEAYKYAAATSVGGGQAHNNMPPYLAVYMWKRIS